MFSPAFGQLRVAGLKGTRGAGKVSSFQEREKFASDVNEEHPRERKIGMFPWDDSSPA